MRLVSAGTGTATRNPGMALELDWIEDVRVNRSAVERSIKRVRNNHNGVTHA